MRISCGLTKYAAAAGPAWKPFNYIYDTRQRGTSRNQPPGERATLPTTLVHERAHAQERVGEREKRRERENVVAREGRSRSPSEELRRGGKAKWQYKGERVLPAHPRAFSLSCSPWPSQHLQSCGLSLSSLYLPAGATGHVSPWAQPGPRATSHGPRGPADTTSSTRRHATVTFSPSSFSFSPSRSAPRAFVHSLSLSFPRSSVHTRRVRPSQE